MLQILHLMISFKLVHHIFFSLFKFSIKGVWTVREAADSLINQVIRENLLTNVARNGGYLFLRRRHKFVRIDELAVTGGVVLGVLDAFLMNVSRLRQVASLAHMIDYLQIPTDLIRWWQVVS